MANTLNAAQELHGSPEAKPDIFAPDITMLILTWVTFFSLLAILKKFAWKPILENLDKRENYIRQSLEDADKAKALLVDVEAQKTSILDEAKVQGSQIIQEARKVAEDVAHGIETKAKEHAKSLVDSAHAQIVGEREQVVEQLKREVIDTAIQMAEKVLEENLDKDKNRHLIQQAVAKRM